MLARVRPKSETGAWPNEDTALPEAGKEVGAQSRQGSRPAHEAREIAGLGLAKAQEAPHRNGGRNLKLS